MESATTEETPSSLRPWVASGIAALIACTFAAQRQSARDRLELAGASPPVGALTLPGTDRTHAPGVLPPGVASGERALELAPGADASPPPPLSAALEAAAIETFTEARPGLLDCLRAERATREGVVGKLSVTLRVVDQGFVQHVDLGPSPVRSEAFDECATLTLAALVFPPGVAPRDLTLTYDLR